MKYRGNYIDFDERVECNDLLQLQEHLENSGGYGGGPNDEFRNYETASIIEFNFIRRETAQHYFSMKDRKWRRSPNKITLYRSWSEAVEPLRTIAMWILEKLGYRQAQDKAAWDAIKERENKNTAAI